jgi:hypothetical protein
MSSARPPAVARQHSPNESSQLEALKMLLERGSKTAAGTSSGEDGTKHPNSEGRQAWLGDQNQKQDDHNNDDTEEDFGDIPF